MHRIEENRGGIDGRPIVTDEERGASQAAQTWQPRLGIGMCVSGSAGEEAGQVKEIRADGFLVDRTDGEAVVLPYERIHAIIGDRVRLDVPAVELDGPEAAPSAFAHALKGEQMR